MARAHARRHELKSEPYASEIAAPKGGYDLGAYCRVHGLDYVERLAEVTLQRFVDYADWYGKSLVPEVTDDYVTEVSLAGDGFRVTLAGGGTRQARKVVVATGPVVRHHAGGACRSQPRWCRIPPTTPGSMFSRDAGSLWSGRGSRPSTAALLHEAGADTLLVVRRPAIEWLDPNTRAGESPRSSSTAGNEAL